MAMLGPRLPPGASLYCKTALCCQPSRGSPARCHQEDGNEVPRPEQEHRVTTEGETKQGGGGSEREGGRERVEERGGNGRK